METAKYIRELRQFAKANAVSPQYNVVYGSYEDDSGNTVNYVASKTQRVSPGFEIADSEIFYDDSGNPWTQNTFRPAPGFWVSYIDPETGISTGFYSWIRPDRLAYITFDVDGRCDVRIYDSEVGGAGVEYTYNANGDLLSQGGLSPHVNANPYTTFIVAALAMVVIAYTGDVMLADTFESAGVAVDTADLAVSTSSLDAIATDASVSIADAAAAQAAADAAASAAAQAAAQAAATQAAADAATQAALDAASQAAIDASAADVAAAAQTAAADAAAASAADTAVANAAADAAAQTQAAADAAAEQSTALQAGADHVATTPVESYTVSSPSTSGASTMFDEFGNPIDAAGNIVTDTTAAAADIPADVTSAADASGASQEVLPDGSLITNSPDGSTILTEPDGTTYATDAAGNTTVYDSTGAVVTDSSQAGFQMPQIIGKDIGGTLANITNLAKQALTASDIWKKLGGQAPKLAQPTTLKNGAVVTMNRNGTVTTRLANGKTTVSVMPVGQPYTFPDGTTVINNGDGTYTTINADGSSGTGKIPKVAGNSGAGILAVVGIAALALIPG